MNTSRAKFSPVWTSLGGYCGGHPAQAERAVKAVALPKKVAKTEAKTEVTTVTNWAGWVIRTPSPKP